MEKLQWSLILEKEFLLEQQFKEQQITRNEYDARLEEIFRDYLIIDPNHTIARLQVVKALRRKVINISKLETIINNKHLIISEQEESYTELIALYEKLITIINEQENKYRELAELGVNPTHKENLQQFVKLKKDNTIFFEQYDRFVSKKIIPTNERELNSFFNDSILDFTNLSVNYVDKLEAYLKILSQLDHSILVNRILSQVLCYKCFKEEEILKNEEQTEEIINKRTKINIQLCQYIPNDEAIYSTLEKLLLRQEEIIYKKQDQELLGEREYLEQMYDLYSKLVKIRPSNPEYIYTLTRLSISLAKHLMEEAKDAKGTNNRKAMRILKKALEMDSTNLEAILRIGIIQLYNSNGFEAYNTLTSIVEQIDNFIDNDFKIEFCIAYAVSNAHVNKSIEAQRWLEQARQLDEDRKYRHNISFANAQIHTLENIIMCSVLHIGKGKEIVPLPQVNTLINQYEEERRSNSNSKIIFDFRDMDSPKIIGPKKTVPVGSEERVKILEYLLEEGEPKSLKQIQNSCDYLVRTGRQSIKLLRKKIAESFCSNSQSREEFDVTYNKVKEEVLINNQNHQYEWAFAGATYLIKLED